MGLSVWNNLNDPYNREQLANNWAKVDLHDHSPGRGVLIPTEGINKGAIITELIAEHAIIAEKIANEAVGTPQLELNSVGFAQLTPALKERFLTLNIKGESVLLKSGELVLQQETGTVNTLPSANANAIVGVFCGGTSSTVTKVVASGSDIFVGDFEVGQKTLTLPSGHHIIAIGNGAGVWLIVAGEPLNENVWTVLTPITEAKTIEGVKYSESRETEVMLSIYGFPSEFCEYELTIGGVVVQRARFGEFSGDTSIIPASFICPAATTWKLSGSRISEIKESHRTI